MMKTLLYLECSIFFLRIMILKLGRTKSLRENFDIDIFDSSNIDVIFWAISVLKLLIKY